ncbi:MAG: RNA polymerase sigma factor [Mycobacterium sp.]
MAITTVETPDDPVRFTDFFNVTHADVYRAVLVVARDPSVAEDATATAYLRAWEHWSDLTMHPTPKAWVIRVALNDAVSWWRRARRLVSADTRLAARTEPLPDPDVQAAIAALPLRQRQVIALRVVLGFDEAQTAQVLGLAPGTVGVHLHRALLACRRRLAPNEADRSVEEAKHG